MDRGNQRLEKPGDPLRDVWQQERRLQLTNDGQWNRAVAVDVDGFSDCADFAIRYPAGWATIVVWRVLLRIGTTLYESGSGLLPVSGPGVLSLGGDLSTLIHKVRGIPHDGLLIELRVPVAAAVAGVGTVHGKSWARSPADLSVCQVNVDVPQPLLVTGAVGINGQPIEVFGQVGIDPQPIEVFGTVAIAPQPIEVNDAAAARCAQVVRQDAAVFSEVTFAFGQSALIEGHHILNEANTPGYFFTFPNGAVPMTQVPSWLCPVLVPARTSISIDYPPIRVTNGYAWGASQSSLLWNNSQLPSSPKFLVTTFWRAVP